MELLTQPRSSRADIERDYEQLSVSEGMPPHTAFTVAVPRGWRRTDPGGVPRPGEEQPLVCLARFGPSAGAPAAQAAGAELVVWCAFLPRELHATDWLRAWLRSQAMQEVQSREAPTRFGRMADMLARGTVAGRPTLHRLATFKDGDLMFLVDGRFHAGVEPAPARLEEAFLLAVQRFRLLDPTGQLFAEAFERRTLPSQRPVHLLVPGLWQELPAGDVPPGGAALALAHRTPAGTLGQLLVIVGAPGDSAQDLEGTTLQKLATLQVALQGTAEPAFEREEHGRRYRVRSAAGSWKGSPVTVTSTRIELPGGTPAVVILLTPPRAMALEAWAINWRACEIAMFSLQEAGEAAAAAD